MRIPEMSLGMALIRRRPLSASNASMLLFFGSMNVLWFHSFSVLHNTKDKLEDMDISLNNIWILGVRLGADTSNLNISKDIWKIVLLLSYYKNLGYWWPFAVGFMSLCLLVSKLEHFKKSCQKKYFYRLGFIAIFWKTSKTTQLWTSAITKPLDLQCIMRYLWKDNIQIFHLVPKEVMYVQRFGCKQVLKIMATSRTPSFMSDTSISSSLSLLMQTNWNGHFPHASVCICARIRYHNCCLLCLLAWVFI